MYKNVIGVRADFHTLLQGLTRHTAQQLDNIEQAETQDVMYTSRRLMLPMYANVVKHVKSTQVLLRIVHRAFFTSHTNKVFINWQAGLLKAFGNEGFIGQSFESATAFRNNHHQ